MISCHVIYVVHSYGIQYIYCNFTPLFVVICHDLIACSASIVIPCGNPPPITNGLVSLSGTTVGDTATYSCNTGYSLSGSAIIVTCLATGSWSTPPSCTGIHA